jgi:hypothetical protein
VAPAGAPSPFSVVPAASSNNNNVILE